MMNVAIILIFRCLFSVFHCYSSIHLVALVDTILLCVFHCYTCISLHWSILFYCVFSIVIRAFGCIGRYYFIVCFPLLYVHCIGRYYLLLFSIMCSFHCCFYSVFSISLHWSILYIHFYSVFSIVIRSLHWLEWLVHPSTQGTGGVKEYSLHSI